MSSVQECKEIEVAGIDGMEASLCRQSFQDFVREFWLEVPGAANLVWNWHMATLCQELQAVAERVFRNEPAEYDLLVNISPGTSKSTICSILFPAWTWTNMPTARHICASHTDTLVLDLATKSRTVIVSEKYQRLFPGIELSKQQDTKGYFRNTKGGDRLSCTVSGKSPLGFHGHFVWWDDPIDPQKSLSQIELKNAGEFKSTVLESRKVDKSVSVFFGIMQRLHSLDPSGALIDSAKVEGAKALRHICIPAEIADNVQPEELREKYVDGLMDVNRLSRTVLEHYRRSLGMYGYSGQFMQSPVPLSGGHFKLTYFNSRKKAAPYRARRIRYFDRAATTDAGCFTVGVLLAKDEEGEYYVEDVVRGQWEPTERNKRIRATALKDRIRYGPDFIPQLWIEREGGSSGRDAWKGLVRSLDGFAVYEDKITGSKEVRAIPWSVQLAAGNVHLVEGNWDINAFIEEHCLFPLGKYKDQVDAATGAYNLLANARAAGTIRILGFNRKKNKQLAVVVCSNAELPEVVIDDKTSLLVSLRNPKEEVAPPEHALVKLQDLTVANFANLDPETVQDAWDESIESLGDSPENVIMSREDGCKLWKFLLKQREKQPEVFVIQDEGDGRALSVAYAIVDIMRLPRTAVYRVAEPDDTNSGDPPNSHVYRTMKSTRGMVI